jgi:hypothetical protein
MKHENQMKAEAWYWFVSGFMFRGEKDEIQSHSVTRKRFEQQWELLTNDPFGDHFEINPNSAEVNE